MSKVCNVMMEPVENGHKITCCIKEEQLGGNEYTPMMMKNKEYVFSDSDSKKAMEKYLELTKKSKGEEKEDY